MADFRRRTGRGGGSSDSRRRVPGCPRKKWKESDKEEYVQRESRVGWGWDGIVKRGKRYERKVLDATKNSGAVGKGSERKGNNRKKEKKKARKSERTNEQEREKHAGRAKVDEGEGRQVCRRAETDAKIERARERERERNVHIYLIRRGEWARWRRGR